MGLFTVSVTVGHPADPTHSADVDLWVDTGATLSWVPREIVNRLGIPLLGRRSFLHADGRTIERETATALLRLDGIQAGVTVVVAEPGDGYPVGATALETLGFGVDPMNKKLVPQSLLAM
jgi:predicted aspartyl protease